MRESSLMLHGDKSRFAVEWEIDPDPVWPFLLGKLRFWIGGIPVGSYGSRVTLVDVLVGELKYRVGDCGNRRHPRFCGLSADKAYAMLHAGLVEAEPSLAHLVEAEGWARFDISISEDVLDGWRLYLVDCDACARMLVGRSSDSKHSHPFMMEQRLELGEYDETITQFQAELERCWNEAQSE